MSMSSRLEYSNLFTWPGQVESSKHRFRSCLYQASVAAQILQASSKF